MERSACTENSLIVMHC